MSCLVFFTCNIAPPSSPQYFTTIHHGTIVSYRHAVTIFYILVFRLVLCGNLQVFGRLSPINFFWTFLVDKVGPE